MKNFRGTGVAVVTPFKIDSSVPDVVDITGLYENIWQKIDSGPVVSWTDPLSLSDDMFYITTDGSTPSALNFRYATNQITYNPPSLGEGEHLIKVRARNGAGTYGETRTFIVKYDSQATDTVKNISSSVSSSNRVTLNWQNPTETDFNKVVIIRKTNSVSSNVNDGTKVYEGSAKTFTGSVLSSSTKYYFTFWAYDSVGNISSKSSVSVTTFDVQPPSAVGNFNVSTQADNSVKVTWENPQDSDFAKVFLYRDGTVIYEGNLQNFIDNIGQDGSYKYEIYAYDTSGNVSSSKTFTLNFSLPVKEENIVLVKDNSEKENVVEGTNSEVNLGENVEIQIPVNKILGDIELKDDDRVVLTINDVEYEMTLSDDKTYFTTEFVAPDVEGTHRISAVATRDGEVLGQLDMNIDVADSTEIVEEESSNLIKYILIGLGGLGLLIVVTLIIKRKGKK